MGKIKKVFTPSFHHFRVKTHGPTVAVRFKENESSFVSQRDRVSVPDPQNNHEIDAGQGLFSHLSDKETESQES